MKFEEKSILFLWKKSIFLSITIFLPDFYHLVTCSEQIIVFCAKCRPIFSTIRYVYDVKSPYFVEKSDIYQIKKILCSQQDIHQSLELSLQLLTLVPAERLLTVSSPYMVKISYSICTNKHTGMGIFSTQTFRYKW